MGKALIVDDEKILRSALSDIIEESGFPTFEADCGKTALKIFEQERPSVVLLDLKMPDMDGAETMAKIKMIDPNVPVIIITGHGDIPTAVEMIKLGAYDFIIKPPNVDRLIFTLKRAMEKNELQKRVKDLDNALETSLEYILGKSPASKSVIGNIRQVANTDFSIIIHGETGAGKTTIARLIHEMSGRKGWPFIVVDIGAIPESLIESELFGHSKGAFTGADKKRKGFFEAAHNGTILIDELQNASPSIQSKILRVVEEKKIYPLGSSAPIEVDVRIIAAANTDVMQAVKDKKLREDLFFRLSEFMINLPPLRDRVDDIIFFSQRFYLEACHELNKPTAEITSKAFDFLKQYPWPGNIRELKNVIRRAVLLSNDSIIGTENLNFIIGDKEQDSDTIAPLPLKELSANAVRDVEKKAIKQALTITNNNKTKAAAMLQIDYKTLLTKIKEYMLSS
jgi:DNA-binding NtrC family response regulator